ncbi:MAG: 3'-5' exonuclease [Deltaproteobacteria bacterium]|nr:3'-5' exonuclease [Deltaproteobacteria bacterium]
MSKASLFDLEYVIFDFETTGLEADKDDEIIEIGAIKLKGAELTGETFSSLINIQRKIPEKVKTIHGIQDEDIKDKPTIEEIFPKFLNFLGNKILIAHNAEFDLGFLKKNLRRFPSFSFPNYCIDTLQLSRQFFSYEKGHSLNAIASRFEIPTDKDRHRSLGDCHLTAKIFSEFLKALKRRKCATLAAIKSCIFPPPKMVTSLQPQELTLL